jgi:hypothetical protein
MKKLIGIAVLMVFAMVGVFVKYRHASKSTSPEAEVADLNPQTERHEVVVKHVISFEPPHAVRQEPPPPMVTPDVSQESATVSPEKYAQDLEAAFRSDAPAGQAAKQTADSITSAFNSPIARGATLQHVECHATRCRMEIRFDSVDTDKRIFTGIFDLLSSNGVDTRGLGFVVPARTTSSDGKIDATVHLFHTEDPSG